MRIQRTHQLYDGHRVTLAFHIVLNGKQKFHHFLDIPAVLFHYQVITRGIVFH
jgi:hypothetical protein